MRAWALSSRSSAAFRIGPARLFTTAGVSPNCMWLRIRAWSGPSRISIHRSRYGANARRSARTSAGAASTNPLIRSALSRGSWNRAWTASYVNANQAFSGG